MLHPFYVASPSASVAVAAHGIRPLDGLGRRYWGLQWCSCRWTDMMVTAMVAGGKLPDGGRLESRRGAEHDISGRRGPGPSWSVANKRSGSTLMMSWVGEGVVDTSLTEDGEGVAPWHGEGRWETRWMDGVGRWNFWGKRTLMRDPSPRRCGGIPTKARTPPPRR